MKLTQKIGWTTICATITFVYLLIKQGFLKPGKEPRHVL